MAYDMKQFTLLDFDMKDVDTLYKLYGYSLNRDPMWHFFWEGKDTYIRVSANHVVDMEADLEVALGKFWPEGKWTVIPYEENIPITQKYILDFLQVFHAFSVLAMTVNDGDFMRVFERITHCALNNFRTHDRVDMLTDFAGDLQHADVFWEASVLNYVAAKRSFWLGQMMKGYIG